MSIYLKLEYEIIYHKIDNYYLIRRDKYSSLIFKLPFFFNFSIKEYDVNKPESIINGSV